MEKVKESPRFLETERLILGCPTSSDGAAVNAAIRESWPELSVWMEWAQGEPPSFEETAKRVGSREKGFLDRTDFSFTAFERASGRFVGMFSLFSFEWTVPKGEIGYWLRTSATGFGYATEATLALTKLGLETLNLARIEIRCGALNLRSRAVAERAGYTLDGVLKNECRNPQGQFRDTCIYSCT
jgi:ribosomal-protein-serine acetyltransferase